MPFEIIGQIRTRCGQLIDLNSLSPDQIHLEDIAHALSMQCRFNGHVPYFYSVAEHSLLVADRLPEKHKAWGLLHDASEAYVGDLISPIKRGMPDYQAIENTVQQVIAERFGLPQEIPQCVHWADKAQLEAEMCSQRGCWSEAPQGIEFLSPPIAKSTFLARARSLGLS